MNISLFLTIFFSLAIFYLILGFYASKGIKNTNDYFLAGRKLGFFAVTFTLIAAQLGGGMLLGTSQKAYEIGIYGILYTLGISIGFILLSLGLAAKLQETQAETTAQLFEIKYNSQFLKKIASLLSIATLFGILLAQIVASKSLLSGLNISNEFIFLSFWAFIIGYTMIGGLKALVLTDTAQVLLIILVFVGLFFYNIKNENLVTVLFSGEQKFTFDTTTILNLLPTLLVPAFFALIEQDLAQRFFAAKTKKIAALAAIASGIFMTLFALVPVYFGIKAKALGLNLNNGASPLVAYLEYTTNDFVFIIAICGIMAALTSTATSLLCATSSNIAQDFNLDFLGIKNKLTSSKVVTLIVGIAAVIFSYVIAYDIIDILIESYKLSVSCLFVPTIASLFLKQGNKNSAILSVIFGAIGFVIFKIYPIPLQDLVILMISLIGFIIGSKIKKIF